jgi:hypothetical protein
MLYVPNFEITLAPLDLTKSKNQKKIRQPNNALSITFIFGEYKKDLPHRF